MFTMDSKHLFNEDTNEILDIFDFLKFNHKVVIIDHNTSLKARKIN